jgi:hypothetical protein
MLQAWSRLKSSEFSLIDSHEKVGVRDSSGKQRLRTVLAERLRNSRNMVLIISDKTRFDTDWVPFEIAYAVDTCKIPIMAAYPAYSSIRFPGSHAKEWPAALAERIRSEAAHVIHVPFKQAVLANAIGRFDYDNYPKGKGLGKYSDEAYASFGISIG